MQQVTGKVTTLIGALQAVRHVNDRGVLFVANSKTENFVSYHSLCQRAEKMLYCLTEAGVKRGDELVLYFEDEETFVVVFWACLLGGIVAVPLACREENEYIAKLNKVWDSLHNPFLLCDEQKLAKIKVCCQAADAGSCYGKMQLKHISLVALQAESSRERSGEAPVVTDPDPNGIAYIQFSSGSTGDPKGVILTHNNLVYNTNDIITGSDISAVDSMLSWMPLTHDMGLIGVHITGLMAAISQVIMPTGLYIRKPATWLELATRFKSTLLYSPNFGLHYLLSYLQSAGAAGWDLSAVRMIYTGAEQISPALIEQFLNRLAQYALSARCICPCYGLAEASVAVTLCKAADGFAYHTLEREHLNMGDTIRYAPAGTESESSLRITQVGSPVEHCRVRICGRHGEVVAERTIGEIQVKGPNVTRGYYNNLAATAAVFTDDGWLKTGDLGFLADGKLAIAGRKKNIIIVNGQNYYPYDLENLISTRLGAFGPGKIVVSGCRDDQREREEIIVFLLFRGALSTFASYASQVKSLVYSELGLEVKEVVPVKKIPKTTSGKVQHFKLVADYRKGAFARVLEQTGSPGHRDAPVDRESITEHVIGLCNALIKGGRIGAADHLLASGIDSIKAIRLCNLIQQTYRIAISLSDLFQYPTASQMAGFIGRSLAQDRVTAKAIESQDHYPVSFGQKKLYLLHQYDEQHNALNVATAGIVRGPLDPIALERAFGDVVRQYEVLQTAFVSISGEIRQKVLDDASLRFRIKIFDLKKSENPAKTAGQLANQLAAEPFDLANSLPLKVFLMELSDAEHLLLVVVHHLVFDGWSAGVMLDAVRRSYHVYRFGGSGDATGVLPLQYRDYAVWQLQNAHSQQMQRHRDYWLKEFREDFEPLRLPISKPGCTTQTFKGDCIEMVFGESLTRQLGEFSKTHEVTVFVTLAAALQVLLQRYSGQSDLVIGIDAAGRANPALENQLGYFVNVLPVRASVFPDEAFVVILKRAFNKIVAAFEHQAYPYDLLVEELASGSTTARPRALFNVLLLFQNFEQAFNFTGLDGALRLTPVALATHTSIVDLQFEFFYKQGALALRINFNTDLFEAQRIESVKGHFQTLLQQLVLAPQAPVGNHQILTEEEKCQLVTFNRAGAHLPAAPSFLTAFARTVALFPDHAAVCCRDSVLTYAELERRSNRLARLLTQTHGVGTSDRVGILMDRSELLVIGIVGIVKTGATLVMLDGEYPEARIGYMLRDSNAALLVTDQALNRQPGALTAAVRVCDVSTLDRDAPDDDSAVAPVSNPAAAYIMYTSGSTGEPKGVLVHHRALADYVQTFIRYFELTPTDRIIQQASLAFDTSVEEIFPALAAGAQLLPVKEGGRDIAGIQRLIEAQRATLLTTTPLVIHALNREPEKLRSLRALISGGEELKPGHIDNLLPRLAVFNTYGPTEATVCVAYNRVTRLEEAGVLGYPLPNHEIYLLDDRLQPVPVGFPGELWIAGTGLAEGYVNRVEETCNSFVGPQDAFPSRVFRTGDIGAWLGDGRIRFIGRKDFRLKVRGYLIDAREVEAQIVRHLPATQAVVKAEEIDGVQSLVAYLESDEPVEVGRARKTLAGVLPHYMIPAYFIPVERFSPTVNGKLDTKTFAGTFGRKQAHRAAPPPATRLEEQMLVVWKGVFATQSVDVWSNFFDLGGHSILAMQLINRVESELAEKLCIRDIFENPSVRDLASLLLARNGAAESSPIRPVEDQQYYEASHAQRRLWILNQFAGNQAAYNLSWAYQFAGRLDVEGFAAAFEQLIARHEILRTNLVTVAGAVKQVVRPFLPGRFRIDYLDLPETEDTALALKTLAQENARAVFDLESDFLLRARLVRLREDRHLFLFAMHHSAADGWSVNVLVKELSMLYNALRLAAANPLPELKFQHKDYTHWQQEQLNGETLQKSRAYWLDQFRGSLPVLAFPADFPRPPLQTYAGNVISFYIDQTVIEGLAGIGRSAEASLFMVLLAATKALLYHYTRQEDIVVGTPVAGRRHQDLEDQVGCLLNTLALRTQFAAGDSFADLLTKVKRSVLNAYEHQDYPFERLVAELTLERDTSRSPLFDVSVGYQSTRTAHQYLENFAGVTITEYKAEGAVSQFDLSVDFVETNGRLRVDLEYNTDLFRKERISRMAGHFGQLLSAVTADPRVPLASIDMLTAPEKEQLLGTFNRQDAPAPENKTFHELFEAQVRKTPGAAALVDGDAVLTYDCLNRCANRVAHYLLERMVTLPGQCIGVMSGRCAEAIIACIGIMKAGAAFLAIDPDYPAERIAHIIADSDLKLLLTDGSATSPAPASGVTVIDLAAVVPQLQSCQDGNPGVEVAPDRLAYAIYTSASTGAAKGVGIEHRNLTAISESWQQAYALSTFPVNLLQVASFSFDVFCGDLCRALLNGGKMIICPSDVRPDPALFYQMVCTHRVTLFESTPALILPFARYVIDNQLDVSCIKLLIVGSDTFLVEDYKKLLIHLGGQTTVINSYGTTEATIDSSYYQAPVEDLPPGGNVPIGRPLRHVTYYLFDDKLNLVPIGVAGELYIGGAGVGRGYLNRPELTREKFINNPYKPGERLYRTGDVGRWMPDGNVAFLGRNDHQVKVRGHRIELGEIENVLLRHPAIAQAVVVCRENRDRENEIVAYYVGRASGEVSGLRQFMADYLPAYMLPAYSLPVPSLPLTPNGKVDVKQLPAPATTARQSGGSGNIRNALQKMLIAIWEEVLDCRGIGLEDNFFDLGGHSLKAARVVSRINEALAVKLGLRELFQHPTIADLWGVVKGLSRRTYEEIAAIEDQDYYEASHAQKRLWVLNRFGAEQLAYNMPALYRLRGNLDREALQHSFAALMQRHDILRTQFVMVEDTLVQKVCPAAGFTIAYVDLRAAPAREERISDLIGQELATAFDLAEVPLLRARLIHREDEEYLLLFNMHHITSDGWSTDVLIRELTSFYNAYSLGLPAARLPLPLQYKDYTAWQQKRLMTGRLEGQRNYWMSQLAGTIPVLQLPTDYSRMHAKDYAGATTRLALDQTLADGLKGIGSRMGVSLYVTLLSAIKALIYRSTGQEDIIVGVPVAGREHASLGQQIGFYVNTLPLRTRLNGDESFGELLGKVNEAMLNALENQDYPFDLLVQQLGIVPEPGRSPLFEVLVVMQQTTGSGDEDLPMNGVWVQEQALQMEHCKFDLVFSLSEKAAEIAVDIQYRKALFKAETIEVVAEMLLAIYRTMVKEPATGIQNVAWNSQRGELLAPYPLDESFDFEF